ncbi:hypothetical protein SAMN05421770_11228 [Granulicella rosea]|uniref:CopG family transcriptional regulator n=1 Tax=Granulicella rosea TaxID=474952 RepID=A0A239MHE0_9BACT|nr:hypothetical protein [Granulicella rosea]SNT41358.1 hypothetical protein SAMN05421770_11228 [Granulicella rosea]
MEMTLTIDDDVLAAAEERAAAEHRSVGEVISSLARQAIHTDPSKLNMRNGVPLLPVLLGDEVITSEHVYRLQDELV